ncbi:hypothetical protein A2U01_0082528, partial [Trifolium medium]|nr:hypothetical protein [Trifolium medium]
RRRIQHFHVSTSPPHPASPLTQIRRSRHHTPFSDPSQPPPPQLRSVATTTPDPNTTTAAPHHHVITSPP